jgi:UDP:flavonoid glycosyltransferase YjiC (YdhE family)
MQILFMGIPLAGHLYPMTPLMHAAQDAGHDVEVLAGSGAAQLLPQFSVTEAGPSVADAMAETERRIQGDDGRHPGTGAIEMFGGVRSDLGASEILAAATTISPGLVIGDVTDQLAPLVAAHLNVPLVQVVPSGPLPGDLMAAIEGRADASFATYGLQRPEPVAVVDTYPTALLQADEAATTAGHLLMRPAIYGAETAAANTLQLDLDQSTPIALVTFGTSVIEPDTENALVRAIADAGFQVISTATATATATATEDDHHARIWRIGFTPLSTVLPLADVVVSAGGTGTVLAAVASGVPLVIWPFLADQPWNAARLAATGASVTAENITDAVEAVHTVASDRSYQESASEIAAAIEQSPSAHAVLTEILVRVGRN